MFTHKFNKLWIFLGFMAVCVIAADAVFAENHPMDASQASDSLYQALKDGNAEQVKEILVPEVLIYESGGVESSLEEYASQHMVSDMQFMKTAEREVISRETYEGGDIAVITTRARLDRTVGPRTTSIMSNETLVLQRRDGDWKVTHIHWSSKRM